ncbi:Zf-FLZ domain [Sesbania bispinosa]|nr:Zf-FLZ domain [Sesbania bispinosa]
MADSSSNFSLPRDALSLRQTSFSIFHNSGSRVGVGAKGLPDSESLWSPTSPLDCRVFSNLSSPSSVKSSRPSFRTGHKQLDCSKVGLGIISSLVNETKLNNEIPGKIQRKNIIFGPQVKTGILKFSKNNHESLASHLKSNSLPKNYVMSLPSKTKSPNSEVESFDDVNWEPDGFKSTVTSLPDSSRPSSLINSNQNSNLGINDLFVESTSTAMSLPPVTSRSSQVDNSLKVKSSSLPISIDLKEEPAFRSSQVPTFSEGSAPHHFDNVLSFCYSCNKKLEEGEDIYMYRSKQAFCCFNCQSEGILAEEEMEKTCTNSAESSPDSSYHDIFLKSLLVSK